ncbi:CheR family methyltransferase [Pseudodesulfovibrio cashew]|nr:CheR family methyltransferase [Pseudodesulfovibrio cashew]
MGLLDWIHRHNLKAIFSFLRYRVSPAILQKALDSEGTLDEIGRRYALGVSMLKIGRIYKTTGLKRTTLAHEAVFRLAQQADCPSLMEIGVSDGCSALPILSEVDRFRRIILTDRFTRFYVRAFPGGQLYLDGEQRRHGVKFLCFYFFLNPIHVLDVSSFTVLDVINPILQKRYKIYQVVKFDMFTDTLDSPVDIIKCSNILNDVYFSEEEIHNAIYHLAYSLKDGGHIVISQNNDSYKDGEAVLVLKKQGSSLLIVESLNGHTAANMFDCNVE